MNNIIKLDHKITYNDINLFEKFNVITDEEKEQIVDIIYKYDLICIFGLDDFLEDIINKRICQLYDLMNTNKEIKDIITQSFNWNPYMNLYNHNCQHFSHYVKNISRPFSIGNT
jgi:hypothetical protein